MSRNVRAPLAFITRLLIGVIVSVLVHPTRGFSQEGLTIVPDAGYVFDQADGGHLRVVEGADGSVAYLISVDGSGNVNYGVFKRPELGVSSEIQWWPQTPQGVVFPYSAEGTISAGGVEVSPSGQAASGIYSLQDIGTSWLRGEFSSSPGYSLGSGCQDALRCASQGVAGPRTIAGPRAVFEDGYDPTGASTKLGSEAYYQALGNPTELTLGLQAWMFFNYAFSPTFREETDVLLDGYRAYSDEDAWAYGFQHTLAAGGNVASVAGSVAGWGTIGVLNGTRAAITAAGVDTVADAALLGISELDPTGVAAPGLALLSARGGRVTYRRLSPVQREIHHGMDFLPLPRKRVQATVLESRPLGGGGLGVSSSGFGPPRILRSPGSMIADGGGSRVSPVGDYPIEKFLTAGPITDPAQAVSGLGRGPVRLKALFDRGLDLVQFVPAPAWGDAVTEIRLRPGAIIESDAVLRTKFTETLRTKNKVIGTKNFFDSFFSFQETNRRITAGLNWAGPIRGSGTLYRYALSVYAKARGKPIFTQFTDENRENAIAAIAASEPKEGPVLPIEVGLARMLSPFNPRMGSSFFLAHQSGQELKLEAATVPWGPSSVQYFTDPKLFHAAVKSAIGQVTPSNFSQTR